MVSNKKIILEININVKAQSEWATYKVKGGQLIQSRGEEGKTMPMGRDPPNAFGLKPHQSMWNNEAGKVDWRIASRRTT